MIKKILHITIYIFIISFKSPEIKISKEKDSINKIITTNKDERIILEKLFEYEKLLKPKNNLTREKIYKTIDSISNIAMMKNLTSNETLFFTQKRIKLYLNQGHYVKSKGNIESAKILYNNALTLSIKINDSATISSAYNGLGNIEQRKSNYKKSKEYFLKSIIYNSSGYEAYTNIANNYMHENNYKEAVSYFHKAHDITLNSENEIAKGITSANLGFFYYNLNNKSKALKYFEKSYKAFKTNEHEHQISVLINIASCNLELNKLNEAFIACNNALGLINTLNVKLDKIGYIYSSLGKYYSKNNNLESSIKYHLMSVKEAEKYNNTRLLSHAYSEIADIENKKNNKESAIQNAMKSYLIAKEKNYVESLEHSSLILSEIYEEKGKSEKALEYFKIHYNSKLKSFSEASDLKVANLEAEISFKEQKKQILEEHSVLLNEKEKINKIKTILLIIIVMFLISSYIILYFKKLKRQINTEKLVEELRVLKIKTAIKDRVSNIDNLEKIELNKDEIEKKTNTKLNQTDWKILNILSETPTITNKLLAEKLYLSVPGIRSSLSKMYAVFNIDPGYRDKRLLLIIEATKLS
jgi:tetratricopeptide (TPR) repeat protein